MDHNVLLKMINIKSILLVQFLMLNLLQALSVTRVTRLHLPKEVRLQLLTVLEQFLIAIVLISTMLGLKLSPDTLKGKMYSVLRMQMALQGHGNLVVEFCGLMDSLQMQTMKQLLNQ